MLFKSTLALLAIVALGAQAVPLASDKRAETSAQDSD